MRQTNRIVGLTIFVLAVVAGSGCGGVTLGTHERFAIQDSVIDIFGNGNPEFAGYGRYTYIVSPSTGNGLTTLIRDLSYSTPFSNKVDADPRSLNAFEFPLGKSFWTSHEIVMIKNSDDVDQKLNEYYDIGVAHQILIRMCGSPAAGPSGICPLESNGGPYLLIANQPFSAGPVPSDLLVVDLTRINPACYNFFIDIVKTRVRDPNLSGTSRLTSVEGNFMSIQVSLIQWMGSVGNLADVIHLFHSS